MPSFIMLVGVPGSGKSTYARKLKEQDDKYVIISRDDCVMLAGSQWKGGEVTYTEAFKNVDQKHVDRIFNGQYSSALAERKDIVLDMTNLTEKSRRAKLAQVSSDYTKYVLFFPITEQTMLARAEARVLQGKIIPEKVLKQMYNSLQVPSESEGFSMVGIIHD